MGTTSLISEPVSVLANNVPQEVHKLPCKGLRNFGSTCYFNSVVQLLLHCSPVRQGIDTAPHSINALRELSTLFMSMTNNDDMTFISPWVCYQAIINTERCRALHMNKNQQEDVHEFFILLLEHFQDELTKIAEVFNLIHVFNIFLRSTITCQGCSRIVEERQWYWNLTLHFPRVPHSQELNIYSLLDAYFGVEIVGDYTCSQCHLLGRTDKKISMIKAPQVLLIQVVRFNIRLQKINDFVKFPLQLTTPHISNGNEQSFSYQLRGLIVHVGSSLNSGHYICYFYNKGNWYKADDRKITLVSWQRVSESQAYILVYTI